MDNQDFWLGIILNGLVHEIEMGHKLYEWKEQNQKMNLWWFAKLSVPY